MKTVDRRKICNHVLAIGMIVGLIGLGVGQIEPILLWGSLMWLSPSGWETFFNVVYFGSPLFFGFYFLALYLIPSNYDGPYKDYIKYCRPLIGAFFLILCASELFRLYDGSIDAFHSLDGLKPDEEAVRTRLIENLSVLRFVVPGVMLGVAVDLIARFLNDPSILVPQRGRNSDKSQHP